MSLVDIFATLFFDSGHSNSESHPHLQFNRKLDIYNTQLLNRYASIDPRVSRLGRFVNWWAGYAEIRGEETGFLSSYAWLLQVIEYVKHCKLVPSLEEPPFAPEHGRVVDGHNIHFFEGDDNAIKKDPRRKPLCRELSEAKERAGQHLSSLSDLALGFMEFCSLSWMESAAIVIRVSNHFNSLLPQSKMN